LNRAFKYRLKPTKEQQVLIQKTFGSCRFIYNKMLEDKINAYNKDKTNLKVTPAKYKSDFEWLKEVDSYALCNEQMHLQTAYSSFFRNPKKVGFPKFKSKKSDRKSYTTSNVHNIIRINDNHQVHLSKLGWVRFIEHRKIPTDHIIKSATISQSATGKYYISILTEYVSQSISPVLDKYNSLGLDYSSHDFYIDSDGGSASYPRFFRKYESKLSKEQRKLSHMKCGSLNYKKQKVVVAKIHEKITNSRNDFCHKLSKKLADTYDYVFVEDINLQNISKGLHLGKSTLDNGFGIFREYLKYKMADRGKKLIKIGKYDPTSTVCSECGTYHKDIVNTLSVREWTCPDCGAHHNRDVNAAKNIRKIGLSLI